MRVSDEYLASLATSYFGGRARAAHVMACDSCHVADDGSHVICPTHPDKVRTKLVMRPTSA
jgi:hypothetical protein